jgi:hypothetical protein
MALFLLEDRRQLQMHANVIHHLEVMYSACPTLEGIAFPRLTSLLVPFSCPLSRYQLFLQPNLAEFSYLHRPPPELGAALAERCPRLRTVKLGVPRRTDDEDRRRDAAAWNENLRGCSLPLAAIRLRSSFVPDCDAVAALVQHLAQRPKLTDLRLGCIDGGARLETALNSLRRSAAFRNLRRLHLMITTRHVGIILSMAPYITSLHLSLRDKDYAVLPAVTRLTALESPTVIYNSFATVPSSCEMATLRQLHRLRSLAIESHDCGDPLAMSDDDFDGLMASLPRLERLKLDIAGHFAGLSGAALRSVGERCRNIVWLEVSRKWDLSSWQSSTYKPLFPTLAVLRLGDGEVLQDFSTVTK